MLKKLSRLIGGRAEDGPPGALVAVFGKHPGWNDHMQELGLDSTALADLRRDLYTEGVGRNIDLGTWDALDPADRVPTFAHVFLRVRPDDVVVGRLWSSTDGRGRALYPMVLAVQCAGVGPAEAVKRLTGPVRETRDRLQAAADAAAVRAIHGSLARTMATALAGGGQGRGTAPGLASARGTPPSNAAASAAALASLAADDGFDGGTEGLVRVLYELERELGPPGDPAGRRRTPEGRGSLHRVPRGTGDAETSLARWYSLLSAWEMRDRGVLLLGHDEMPWIDIAIGPPTAARLACLRSGVARIPLSSSVPFSMDAAFRSRLTTRIAAARGA